MTETIDKSTWGEGPWQSEPDRVDFRHAGLPCLALRHPRQGHWCGYAAVPPGHPAHGKDRNCVEVEVHGGLSYEGLCDGLICHVPAPGEPDDVWWLGFDFGHAWDILPGQEARGRSYGMPPIRSVMRETYRDLAYVRAQVESLAEQLAGMA
jgi:hypothetical protein